MRLLTLTLIMLLIPAVASASGFYLTENGGKAMMMGGAFAGEADDLSAIQHNPAGLAQLKGFNFLVDAQLVFHNLSFERIDPGFMPGTMSPANKVSNAGGPFPVPMLGLGYTFNLLGGALFVGGGLYGPPSDGKYVFPAPDYTREMGKYVASPKKFSPQRYSLIDSNILIVFPSVSIAYAPIKQVAFGVSLQPVLASFDLEQAVTSIDRVGIHPTGQATEDPFYDTVVGVHLPLQYTQFTAVFGALVKPTGWLQFGASFRPQVMVNAKGALDIQPGEAATALGTMVTPEKPQTTLSIMLPAELKVGVHVQPIARLGINFDFVYQGWQALQEIVLDPQNVSLVMGTSAPQPVAGFRIQKHFHNAYNFRLGASYALFDFLSLYLGGAYETSAISDEYIALPFVDFAHVNLSGGVGLKLGGFEVLLGAAGAPPVTREIAQSQVEAGSTETYPAPIVGTGRYTSGTFMLSLGLRGSFGGQPKAAPPPEPAPAPAPATEPAPAAPAAPTEAPKS